MAVTDINRSGTTAGGDSDTGNGMMSRVRESAAAQLSSQKNRATDGLGSVAQAVRQSTQQLRDQHHETLAGYVEGAANQIERLAQRLREKDLGELLEDAQRLARRQPAAFIGSAFVVGLLGVRFLKSSRGDRGRHEYERYPRSGRSGYSGGTAGAYSSSAQREPWDAGSTPGGAGSTGAGYAAGASGTEMVSSGAEGTASTETAAGKRDAGAEGPRTGTSTGTSRSSRGAGKEKS